MEGNDPGIRKSMPFGELVAWAWRETAPVHRERVNLLIHLFAVPLFVLGHIWLVMAVFNGPRLALAGVLAVAVSLVLQKAGHAREPVQVLPFAGGRDIVRRIYAEQFCNFWRFLFSGQWFAAWKGAAS